MTTISVGTVFPNLTHRERQVCAMIMSGLCTKEIAMSLSLSPRTVEDHRASLYQKTEMKNLAQIACRLYGGQKVVA